MGAGDIVESCDCSGARESSIRARVILNTDAKSDICRFDTGGDREDRLIGRESEFERRYGASLDASTRGTRFSASNGSGSDERDERDDSESDGETHCSTNANSGAGMRVLVLKIKV